MVVKQTTNIKCKITIFAQLNRTWIYKTKPGTRIPTTQVQIIITFISIIPSPFPWLYLNSAERYIFIFRKEILLVPPRQMLFPFLIYHNRWRFLRFLKNIQTKMEKQTNKQTNGSITGRNKNACKRIKLEFFLTLYIKNNSKWIIRAKTIKFLERIELSNSLIDTTPQHKQQKKKIN